MDNDEGRDLGFWVAEDVVQLSLELLAHLGVAREEVPGPRQVDRRRLVPCGARDFFFERIVCLAYLPLVDDWCRSTQTHCTLRALVL